MKSKRWAWLPLLLALPLLALACGDGGNDEDAVRDAIREGVAAFNDRDADKLSQLVTANFFGVEPTAEAIEDVLGEATVKIENVELLSVTVDDDKATAEITRTLYGKTIHDTMSLVKVDSRWLLERWEDSKELTAEEELLASMALTAQEVREALPEEVETSLGGPERGERSEGEVARWAQRYESAGGEMVAMDLRLYETAAAAAERFAKESDPSRDPEHFDITDVGDEAEGGVSESPDGLLFTNTFLRVDRVLVLLAVGPSEEEQRAVLLALAERLAEKVEAALEG